MSKMIFRIREIGGQGRIFGITDISAYGNACSGVGLYVPISKFVNEIAKLIEKEIGVKLYIDVFSEDREGGFEVI